MKDTKAHPAAESPPSAEAGPIAERVLKALAKLVNGRKIYADNNPRLEQFRDEFQTSLRQFLEFDDELVLTIEQYSIRWQDLVVYENTRRDESLAFILFKDGIGELTVMPGAVGAETDRLVQILADELHHLPGDDDVVTRFWNADFEHITYRVLDDYLATEFGAGSTSVDSGNPTQETADQAELLPSLVDKGRVIVQRSDSLESIDVYLQNISRLHHPDAAGVDAELAYQRMLRTTLSIPVEEIDIYKRELERERGEDGIAVFMEAIYVFILLSDTATSMRDVSSILERLVEHAVSEREPATLERIVRFIRDFETANDVPAPVKKFDDKMLARLGDPALVSAFLDELTGVDARAGAIISYAVTVGAVSVEPLLRALHDAESVRLHRRICDALIAICGDDAGGLIDRLDIDHAEVAVDAVYIAKTVRLPALTPRLRELVFYPDARVKLEMLGWIAARNDADSTELLVKSLDDLDKRVRLKVLDVLCDRREPRVRDRITELAFGKDLAERAPDEQDAIFKTLGHVGGLETVDHLRALVERRKLIPLGKSPDAKYLAIRALERIRERAAVELLAKLAEDPNEAVRLRAQRAKEALAASMAGAPAGGPTRVDRS